MTEINKCEVCDSTEIVPKIDLGLHPMCDDLIKIGDNRKNQEYPIKIYFCEHCKTAHQKFQVPKNLLFPSDYHYRARFTGDVLKGMEELVNGLEEKYGSLKNKIVLDIGCNDGSLLDFFKAKGARTYGIEPTDAGNDARDKGHIVLQTYFDKNAVKDYLLFSPKPDIITFTNVFAHIEDLNGLLDNLKELIHENTLLVIENHYLGAVIEKNQFDTFYHEHPRTYSFSSFVCIAKKLGRYINHLSFPSRYNGNIRVIIGPPNEIKESQDPILELTTLHKESLFGEELRIMNLKIQRWKIEKKDEILRAVRKYGVLEAKAFPGRAAIPIKLLELDERHIKCCYEKLGSLKIGFKIPGTNIPILSDDKIKNLSEKPVLLNLAWHISTEIESYLRNIGFVGKFINII